MRASCSGVQATPSSSKMKWRLPMRARSPSRVVATPWATTYSTSAWRSSWLRPFSSAARVTARAMLWGKCSSMQAAQRSSSSSPRPVKSTTPSTWGQAAVRVPVLSKTMVSASAKASRCLPPLTMIRWAEASRMAEMMAMGVDSLMAQE